MPLPTRRPSRAKNPRTNAWYSIEVDITHPQRIIDAVNDSVSPQVLAVFLSEVVHPAFAADIFDRFAKRGDTRSGSWPWLSPATQDIRTRLGYNADRPVNVRTGELFTFVHSSKDVRAEPGGAALEFPGEPGNDALRQKLEHAQQGTSSNPIPNFGPTPPRPVLAVDEMDLASVLEMLQKHVVRYMMVAL
jgi:hypothetical protein